MILSWAFGGNSVLNFLAGMGGLIGIGTFITRMTGYEDLLSKQRKYEHEEQLDKQKIRLDELDSKLINDKDNRTQNTLREIRFLYQNLQDDIQDNVSSSGYQILETIQELFDACVAQLEHSYELYLTARNLSGKTRKEILAERNTIVEDVVETTGHLASAVQQFHLLKSKKKKKDLNALRDELDNNLEIARRVDRELYETMGDEYNDELME